jgi:hypothetical protein
MKTPNQNFTPNLNTQLLATRSDLALQPGLIIDQTPQAGEEVDYGYRVGVTVSGFPWPWSVTASHTLNQSLTSTHSDRSPE